MKKVLFLLAIVLSTSIQANDKPNNKITILEGTVYNDKNESLVGAIIYVEGIPGIGITSDKEGRFNLTIDKDKINMKEKITVTVKYVGYATQKIKVDPNKNMALELDFVLSENSIILPSIKTPAPIISVPDIPKDGKQLTPPNPKFILCE
ncbi:MAG: carboxypeptidase-like regulatory domain-containing protein [Prevotella sp.]|jgi:hypothetical protein|nr:carboxypeptidase-like regulatory domain-containing protein [Prevotella sp.]